MVAVWALHEYQDEQSRISLSDFERTSSPCRTHFLEVDSSQFLWKTNVDASSPKSALVKPVAGFAERMSEIYSQHESDFSPLTIFLISRSSSGHSTPTKQESTSELYKEMSRAENSACARYYAYFSQTQRITRCVGDVIWVVNGLNLSPAVRSLRVGVATIIS